MEWNRFKNRLIARIITRFPSLSKRFVESYVPRTSESVPWTPFHTPLTRCVLAIITTAGVHHRDQRPFDMHDPDGDPSWRVIPGNCSLSDLIITHDYYDHSDADKDMNIVFPLERLREFAAQGNIGGLARHHYGLMGHVTGRHIPVLVNRTARDIARQLKQDAVDAVLLVPG